uniref:Uncharacterized protein n=1 Tax=Pseudomonas phage RVTF4 TaxID=3236931 RepID=A0AB39CCU1_9VIRU
MIHECSRVASRDKFPLETWRAFFAKNPTPFVYMDAEDDSELFSDKNIVGFIKNVKFNDHGFTYEFIVINDEAMGPSPLHDPFRTIEPVYGSITRKHQRAVNIIFGFEVVKG